MGNGLRTRMSFLKEHSAHRSYCGIYYLREKDRHWVYIKLVPNYDYFSSLLLRYALYSDYFVVNYKTEKSRDDVNGSRLCTITYNLKNEESLYESNPIPFDRSSQLKEVDSVENDSKEVRATH